VAKKQEVHGSWRNRIVERRMMKPRDLLSHPGQWRDHPRAQVEAMLGVLGQLGITDSLKAWYSERAGGALTTWDGHLRKGLDPDQLWPVDILDLTDEEADFALATHDPLAAMALADKAALDALLSAVNSDNAAVLAMLADLAQQNGMYLEAAGDDQSGASPWDRMQGGAADGVLFSFGALTCRLPQPLFEAFQTAAPTEDIAEWVELMLSEALYH